LKAEAEAAAMPKAEADRLAKKAAELEKAEAKETLPPPYKRFVV
jgi:hypothetical protein